MSRTGNPNDNAAMQRFNTTYKSECVGLAEERGSYGTLAGAAHDFFVYVEKYYNRARCHGSLGYQTPVDFANQLD
jgi:putative transposase